MSDYAAWRDAFAGVLDPQRYTIEWLDGLVAEGRAIFWGAEDAAMLTELRRYPTGAMDIHGLVAAGALDTIIGDLIPRAEAWAQTAGCIGAVIDSREGWTRALKASGYRPYQTAVRKEL
jgi:hypothetical protein